MDDVIVPAYYVVNRQIPKEEAAPILSALAITPAHYAIISHPNDAELALALSPKLLLVASDESAHALAKNLADSDGCVTLIVGEAEVLDAFYPDGHKEPVACSA